MTACIVYYQRGGPTPGKIESTTTGPEDYLASLAAESVGPVMIVLDCDRVDPFTNYVDEDAGEIVRRPEIGPVSKTRIAADGVDEAVVHGVPEGAVPLVDRVPADPVLDGTFEFSADLPGTAVIEFDHWPFLPFRIEVTVV